jgi:hypothetical protein
MGIVDKVKMYMELVDRHGVEMVIKFLLECLDEERKKGA